MASKVREVSTRVPVHAYTVPWYCLLHVFPQLSWAAILSLIVAF